MVVIKLLTLLLGSLEEIIKGAAELDRWRKLSNEGISALHTVEFLKELGLGVVNRQAVHPFESVGDVGVLNVGGYVRAVRSCTGLRVWTSRLKPNGSLSWIKTKARAL